MSYYKVISGNNIVGIVRPDDFRKYQPKHGLMLYCQPEEVQYAEYKGTFYHDFWMRNEASGIQSVIAQIIEIDEEEYNALAEALETEENIEVPEPEIELPDENDIDETDETIECIREMKIEALRQFCNKAIEGGFEIELSDGLEHHFSLAVTDQLNLLALSSLAMSDNNAMIPYHGDGEMCEFFSATDILKIANAATEYITYHTTWFNSLKAYINSLKTISEIYACSYTMEIPEEYQSDVLKAILMVE